MPHRHRSTSNASPRLRRRQGPRSRRRSTFSNLNKIFWPAERYTKGDLIDYYQSISPWILPYLRNRPLVLTRFPDGIDGKSFYQKDAPEFAPEWIRTIPIWSDDTQRDIKYFVCDDVESLALHRQPRLRSRCTSGTAESGRSSSPTGA